MAKRVVIALGGNAILKPNQSATVETQLANIQLSAEQIAKIEKLDHQIVVTHGNGPQVGNILRQNEEAKEVVPPFPLDVCNAESQGFIGYLMEQSIKNKIEQEELTSNVVTLLTQVEVAADDPAFEKPTKPICLFYSEEEAKAEAEKSGATFKEDAGRGWRKVVASPKPVDIKEINTIRTLLNDGQVVVAAGGGGIPVVKEADGSLTGVEAVIDKDFASQRLAELVEADLFIVLTGVDYVFVNYNKPDQAKLEHVNVAQLEEYIKQDQFAPGSMLPKVEAAIAFVNGRPEGKAVITSLENLGALIESESGTIIQKD